MDFCPCGSIKKNGKCSNQRCPETTQKSKDWIVDGTSMHFKKAVSFEDAVELAEKLNTHKD